jgi:uncharacterized membrane protein (DUF485 family)
MPFAIAELLLIAVLFLLYARHAADYDRIELVCLAEVRKAPSNLTMRLVGE